MKYLKKFESFGPITKPAEPTTKPGTTPKRPSPIRRDRPSVEPAPKAKKKLATAEDVVQRYVDETKLSESSNAYLTPGRSAKRELIKMFQKEDWFETVKMEGQRENLKYIIVANRVLTDEELQTIPDEIHGHSVVIDSNIK